jgi:nitric oxide reductase large subunit
MVIGLGVGLIMGISGNFSLTSVHAHVALLGWATMAITGIVYLVMPDCGRSKLVAFHFWGHNIGLPLMVTSLAVKDYVRVDMGPVIGAGSALVLVSLLLFAINMFRNGGLNHSR